MEEYGSRDGNAHLRSQYSQGVVTPHRPEISDRSIQREQLCFQDYARDCGWVVIVYMCVLCAITSCLVEASEQPYSVYLS